MNEFNVNVAKSRLSVGYTPEVNKLSHGLSEEVPGNQANADYVLLDGPPYANGSAHLGHVLNKDRKSTRLNSSHSQQSRMPSSA